MKIQYQLWGIFSLIFIIISLVVYLTVSNNYQQNLQTGYEQISIAQGSVVIDKLGDTYPWSLKRSMGYLTAYSQQLDVRLIILDEDRKVYADSFQQIETDTALNLEILNLNTLPASHFTESENYGYIQYTLLPFQSAGSEGYLLMIQQSNELYDELRTFQRWMIQILIMSVLAFFLITYIVSSWFTRPISKIINNLRKITPEKRFFQVEYHRKDEIKELIDTTQKMVRELNHYDERQRRFLSTSSHELKTPLATMQLILENLPYVREDEDKYTEFVHDLKFQVDKMKTMVDGLLQINRIWDIKIKKEHIMSDEICEYIIQSFNHIAQDKDIKLEFNIEPMSLYVDCTLFLRALENVVSNAIRYSPKGITIEIIMSNEGSKNKISVCDQGIGISPEDFPHIFEPFYRANDATGWNQEGSGLGLTIVKQMIQIHQGEVEVESQENKGTCVHLFLPREF